MLDSLRFVVRDYDKIGHQRQKKDENHLNKHAMHLIRILMTGIDVLEKHEIITYRGEELPLLMKIRNGGFMTTEGTMAPEFYEILDQYEHRFQEAAQNTTLPDTPDMIPAGAFVERINRHAVMGDYE